MARDMKSNARRSSTGPPNCSPARVRGSWDQRDRRRDRAHPARAASDGPCTGRRLSTLSRS